MGEIDEKVEDAVLTLEQSIRQQGRAEGHASGRVEGHAEGLVKGHVEERHKLTLRMLRNGVDLKTVAKVTEQQPEEIDRILIKLSQEAIA